MNKSMPSVYEAFNARNLSNNELCKTFIVSEHFQNLASSNHSIVVGPRGSGKTTLMRMLQVETLSIWKNEAADSFRNRISFSGIFVPTDRLWKNQSEKLKYYHELADVDASHLVVAAFTYHILEKLTITLSFRAHSSSSSFKSTRISKSNEAELVLSLSSLWKLQPDIPSLRSLCASATLKKKEISDYISTLIASKGSEEKGKPSTITSEISSILGSTISLINNFLDEHDGKWCFLFDELELAPEEIIQPLVDAMRGGPENIILKLSLSPYHRELNITNSPLSSMRNEDLSIISLTGASEQAGRKFSKRLCENIFKKNGLNDEIESYFIEPKPMNEVKVFSELSEKDESFRSYLEKNSIEVKKIRLYKESDKRPTIRKIKFVAYLRNYYLKANRRAGRKQAPEHYAGFYNICKALEYNPRMLIGVMNKLAKEASNGSKITTSHQLRALGDMHHSYKNLLGTIAIDSYSKDLNSLYSVVERIGERLKKEIIGESFIAEPKGTLTFKSSQSNSLFEAIGLALNSGALIIDSSNNDFLFNKADLKSAKCRLSYLFSHHFGILTSKGRSVDIADLLELDQHYIRAVDPTTEKTQLDLL